MLVNSHEIDGAIYDGGGGVNNIGAREEERIRKLLFRLGRNTKIEFIQWGGTRIHTNHISLSTYIFFILQT